jgi:large subunit ribosomal protein L19e
MNLRKKKELAARTFGIGKNRIVFLKPRLNEIKEAITKQDMKDLQKDGAIIIKPVKGRRKVEKIKRKKGPGKVRNKVNKSKRKYVILTRKLRKHAGGLLRQGRISKEELKQIRIKIRNKEFRNKGHLIENLGGKRK